MEFTFGLLMYNQEEYILETLESIKYQIKKYGQNMKIYLIINDDASTDKSVYIAKKWIEVNKDLFVDIIFNENHNNKGTVVGMQYIIDNCITENYRLLACDDLVSSRNLFIQYEKLSNKSMRSFVRVDLKANKLMMNDGMMELFYYNRKTKNTALKSMRRGCYLHTPSTIYRKQLYINSDCQQINKNFRLLEDDPTWYAMIKNNSNLDIQFIENVITLYRVSEKSISNSNQGINIIKPEFLKLWKLYQDDSSGMEKLYFKSKIKGGHNKYTSLYRYMDFFRKIKIHIYCCCSPGFYKFKNKINNIISEEQNYYNLILKNVDLIKRNLKL